ARRAALATAAAECGARDILLAHTLDDQAETVLLGLARGSGAASLAGMAPVRDADQTGDERGDTAAVRWIRPLLTVRRDTTRAACEAAGLTPWHDPHNDDPAYARVRARRRVLPVLEAELGPGIAEALARTAEQLREDATAFDAMVDETVADIVEHTEAGIAVSAVALAANPAALRHRIIRHVVASEFHVSLSRTQTLAVSRLVTDWTGQGPIDLPGCRASRAGGRIAFTAV
ncbi:tRNA lysidine(34) synthetase, partial [Microbacterium sp.]|uniref:tRNA lysidine(34) synthetase n=1 Tax=Microbacterium sp. TaxID=51671 RepID=UPI003A89A002